MKGFQRLTLFLFLLVSIYTNGCAQSPVLLVDYNDVTTGAQQPEAYRELLNNRSIALVANQASLVGEVHLVDTLLSMGINIKKIFCPEHGFRGTADAGELIDDKTDPITGIPIVSLYGKHKKPTQGDLTGVEVVVFDLQDVGVRFYTYVSTMTYVMEACAENGVSMIILDRPNPNGFLIDGPILDTNYRSFVGLHMIPIAHGMTLGEYAQMVKGEKWIKQSEQLNLKVIPIKKYTHNMLVKLATKPSPNLPTWQSVYLYPSLCLFEGTKVSIGRGTLFPFQVYGSPDASLGSFAFTPESIPGMSNHPKHEGLTCFGQNLTGFAENYKKNDPQINLDWLLSTYQMSSDRENFFTNYFDTLAGSDKLRKQIIMGWTTDQIRESWQPDLTKFKKIRKKYLIYP